MPCQFGTLTYPQRKIVPMELYEALMDVWGPQASEGTAVASFLRPEEIESLSLFSPAHTEIVLDCLWDLFDRPRQLGFEMLAKFPTPLPSAISVESVTSLFTYALRLICSPRYEAFPSLVD